MGTRPVLGFTIWINEVAEQNKSGEKLKAKSRNST